MDRAAILKRQETLKATRAKEEPVWRELAKILRPDDSDFNATTERSRRDEGDVFDATPLYALDDFVGGLYSQLVNPANRWFELGVDDDALAKWKPVAQWLHAATNLVYASLAPAASSFYARAPAWFANIGAFGWGALYQEEWVGRNYIIDRAIPIGETYLATDAAGNVNQVNREFSLTGDQIKGFYGDKYQCKDDARYVIVHATFENRDYRPDKIAVDNFPFLSITTSPEVKDLFVKRGYFELPYHVPMWSERSKSPYPTGPGHNQKADAQTLQEMMRTNMVAAQFAAEPPILMTDEAALSAADIEPNAVLKGGMSKQGKRLVEVLERRQQMPLALNEIEQKRNACRTAFRFTMLQVAGRPQMTASEFLGWQEEGLKFMAPNLARIQTGGLSPFIARRFRILERAGQVPPPPPEVNGRRLTINYVSPLAKLMTLSRGRGVLQFQQAIEQMAVTDPAARDWFNADAAAPIVRDAFTEVPDVIRDPREVAELRKIRAEQAQRQAGLEQTGQAVEIAAEASHAVQAATLAGGRGRPQ